ncbi:alpha-2-HS-glycoprotein-like [Festucalex cinctus]
MVAHLFVGLLWCTLAPLALLGRTPLPGAACRSDGVEMLAGIAVRHINWQHKHGYKFKLHKILSSNYRQVPGGCRLDVSLKLLQTKCHFSNPKPHQQCVPFQMHERGAVSTCDVRLAVASGKVIVSKHLCATRPEHTNAEMAWICPDCPVLLPLKDPTGAKAAHQVVLKFNREGQRRKFFTMMEIAQLTSGYISNVGMVTWLELALVETDCPREAENTFGRCTPLCPNRAVHVFCQATYHHWQDQIAHLDCESYPPQKSSMVSGPSCAVLFHQRPEAFACKAQLGIRKPAVHHICPFPLLINRPYWFQG